jgi:hypothetical protein
MAGQGCVAAATAAELEQDQAAAGTAAAADNSDEQDSSVTSDTGDTSWETVRAACVSGVQAVQQLLPAVQLPGAAGCEAACTAARQKLQQQCTQLQQQCSQLQQQLQLGPSDEVSSETASQIGGQLVQVGGALCAQLPVPLCCNNPGCVDLRGASEQQLVAGKGSVCSHCRWVGIRSAEVAISGHSSCKVHYSQQPTEEPAHQRGSQAYYSADMHSPNC